MQLIINGETVSVPSSVGNVSQLLEHYGINQKVAIVELNQDILEKSRHGETALADGDKIEIVHFVGGG
ncbi:thiamine biosynthesis protein ThiS [Mesobacillus campisalis]|jgi:sulfur carrier protein|uniref:Thiamine biosynthesis protein ThiS n=1 Tax=Mesobacillus campisalis TaxID=1408103 RepID=A0A0M2SSL2_9BACI|nr:sulfur carrier protein ThiS [Mesobacillus campisalis]KKK37128.1 thiamine biosynthesis protein ThiS [Mesobacillus campisalis]